MTVEGISSSESLLDMFANTAIQDSPERSAAQELHRQTRAVLGKEVALRAAGASTSLHWAARAAPLKCSAAPLDFQAPDLPPRYEVPYRYLTRQPATIPATSLLAFEGL